MDGYEFYPILDFTSFITGKIDHAGHGSSGLTKAQVKQIQENYPDYTIHEVEYNHISQLPMNPFRAPFDQWKVRWAIHLALDRQAWIEFNKAGTLSWDRASSWSWPEEEFVSPLEDPRGNFIMFFWPSLAAAWVTQATQARMMRSTML